MNEKEKKKSDTHAVAGAGGVAVRGGEANGETGQQGEIAMFEERRRRVIDVITPVDWKNVEWLCRFITENGRILPRRLTGNSQQRQREIARAIKRARHMALLPFGGQSEF